jgi:hypothetical protein
MANISTMLVGKYIYSQLQVIGQSKFFLEAILNRMKSVVTDKKRNKGLLGGSSIKKVSVTEKVPFICHHLNVDGLQH